jgi:hypothetical protein
MDSKLAPIQSVLLSRCWGERTEDKDTIFTCWLTHSNTGVTEYQACTVPVTSLDTPTRARVFLYLYYFLHCSIIVKTSKLRNNTYGII